MGLSATIQQATLAAFNALGDLIKPATYKAMTGGVTRNLAAGTVVANVTTYTLPRSIFTKFKTTENNKDVSLLTDEKILFPATDLPATPSAGDTILDFRGRTWEVIQILSDAAGALYTLHVRTSR